MIVKRILLLFLVTFAVSASAQTCPNPAGGTALACTKTFEDTFNKGVLDQTKWTNAYASTETFAKDRPFWTLDNTDFLSGNGLHLRIDNRVTNFPNGWAGSCTTTGGVTTCTNCPSVTIPAPCQKLYTSPAFSTSGSFYQAYGYFEIVAELPKGPGMFPSFWAWSQDQTKSSEIDVFEGNNLDDVNHTKSYLDVGWFSSPNHVSRDYLAFDQMLPPATTWPTFDPTAGYHTYAMAWTPQNIAFFVDGTLFSHYDSGNIYVPSDPVYLLLDADVGGPGGAPNASTVWPAWMNVQRVTAYQYNSQITTPTGDAIQFTYANPTTHTKPYVTPQTVNPGDTITVNNLTIVNGPGQTLYSGVNTSGIGPHIDTNYKDYNGLNTYNNKAYDVPAPMAPNTQATVPVSATYGTLITLPTTLAPGVYGIGSSTVYNTANNGSTGALNRAMQNAEARFLVVPSTYPILNLNSSPLVFGVTPGKASMGRWNFSGSANQSIAITDDVGGDPLDLWLTAPYNFTVSKTTMLEFDFSSTDVTDAVYYAIGLFPSASAGEYSVANSALYLFQFAGSRALGEPNFKHYANGDGTTHYVIPVGNYYTGAMDNLTIATQGSTSSANATFSNIRFYDLSPMGTITEP